MTIRDKLNSITDDEFSEWLCKQMWEDYGKDAVMDAIRYNQVRNFLKMECLEDSNANEYHRRSGMVED